MVFVINFVRKPQIAENRVVDLFLMSRQRKQFFTSDTYSMNIFKNMCIDNKRPSAHRLCKKNINKNSYVYRYISWLRLITDPSSVPTHLYMRTAVNIDT